MKFKNGKLEITRNNTNQTLLLEFLDDGVKHDVIRGIICDVSNIEGKFKLETTFTHTIYSLHGNGTIIDFVADFNYDIENDEVGLDNDKIDIFKHLSNGAKQVWNAATRTSTYEQNKHKNIAKAVDEVEKLLIRHGYYT